MPPHCARQNFVLYKNFKSDSDLACFFFQIAQMKNKMAAFAESN